MSAGLCRIIVYPPVASKVNVGWYTFVKRAELLGVELEGRPKLQKRAFSAYEHKHWILMRAERAGALPGHARSALAGHRTRGAR